jgi:hypothetical protein
MNPQIDFTSPWAIATGAVAAVLLLLLFVIWRKGRPFTTGHVFRASRLSSGNRLFPTQVHINIAHVASVRIDTGVLFADVYIETSGGASPVKCHGHRKRDALEMQRLIEQFQSAYYRQQPPPPPVAQNETRR